MQRDQRGAIGSAVAAVAVCLVVGVAAGYAVSELTRVHLTDASEAVPMPAGTPSVPTVTSSPTSSPTYPVKPDRNDYPALDFSALTFEEHTIAGTSQTWAYDAPEDWDLFPTNGAGDRLTLPGNPDFTYSLRVNPLTVPASTSSLAETRYAAIASAYRAAEQLEISDHDVSLTYLTDDGYLRYQHSYFISPPGSMTGIFEVTVSGRIRDREGLDALLEYVVGTVHKV
ncbi:MAG TPA: hypothetical protein VGJ41_14685 [Nocardioides sp.]